MRRMRGKSILAVMLSFSMLGGVLSAGGEIKNASAETETPEFGTQIITEDMLNTTPRSHPFWLHWMESEVPPNLNNA